MRTRWKRFWTVLILTSLLALSAACLKKHNVFFVGEPRILAVATAEDGTKTYTVNQAFILMYHKMRKELGW